MSKRLQPIETQDLRPRNLLAVMCGWWLALMGQESILIAAFWLIALIPIVRGILSVICIAADLEPVYRTFRLRVAVAALPLAAVVYAGRVDDSSLAFTSLIAISVSLIHWWEIWEEIEEGGRK